jgi:hypothetical protein
MAGNTCGQFNNSYNVPDVHRTIDVLSFHSRHWEKRFKQERRSLNRTLVISFDNSDNFSICKYPICIPVNKIIFYYNYR